MPQGGARSSFVIQVDISRRAVQTLPFLSVLRIVMTLLALVPRPCFAEQGVQGLRRFGSFSEVPELASVVGSFLDSAVILPPITDPSSTKNSPAF
jgi:hypothetical protein